MFKHSLLWGRCSGCQQNPAGTTRRPGGTSFFLEVDTAIQAIARHRVSNSSSPPQRLNVGGPAPSCHDCAVEVEPLALEVCLFDNNRCSPSSSSSSALLGCGTMVLTPVIIAGILAQDERATDSSNGQETTYQPFCGRVRALEEVGVCPYEQTASTRGDGESATPTVDMPQELHSGSRLREVLLFEPGSGKRMASVTLGVALSLHKNSGINRGMLPPSGSPRATDVASTLAEHLPKVRKSLTLKNMATNHSIGPAPTPITGAIASCFQDPCRVWPPTHQHRI